MIGVRNNNESNNIYGSVWLNELRMTGVKKQKGTAFTSSFSFNLGELFNIDLFLPHTHHTILALN